MQREEIIQHSMEMFLMEGIKSVRMDDIARKLQVSKRTLYEQFHDKEELLYLATEHYYSLKRLEWQTFAHTSKDVLELLFRVLSSIMEQSDTSQRMMDSLKKFYPRVHERIIGQGQQKNREAFREMLRRGIADGLFTEGFHIDLAITILNHTATSLMNQDIQMPQDISRKEAFLHIVCTFFRGISTKQGLERIDHLREYYELKK